MSKTTKCSCCGKTLQLKKMKVVYETESQETLRQMIGFVRVKQKGKADFLKDFVHDLLMGSLHNLPDGQRQARALLEPLLVGRPEVQRERLRTLRALLTEPGPADAAAALGVHRNTLAYRARRIEGRTGWRLTDPDLCASHCS